MTEYIDHSPSPSSPFSFVSSLPSDGVHTDDDGDLDVRSTSDLGSLADHLDDLGVLSASDSDWDVVSVTSSYISAAPPSEFDTTDSDMDNDFSTSPALVVSSSPTPSIHSSVTTQSDIYITPPASPRPMTPPTPPSPKPLLLTLPPLPVSDPTAQPLSLISFTGLPQSFTLDNLVSFFIPTAKDKGPLTTFKGRLALPLWISFRPAFSELSEISDHSIDMDNASAVREGRCTPTQATLASARASALLRYASSEDALSLSDLLDHLRMVCLPEMEDEAMLESWLWVLEADTQMVSDDEVEKGEESKGLLWVSEWLKVEDGGESANRKKKKHRKESDPRTSLLVCNLPYAVPLMALVEFFAGTEKERSDAQTTSNPKPSASKPRSVRLPWQGAPGPVPTPVQVTLLPSLPTHAIYLPCAVLQYASHLDLTIAVQCFPTDMHYDECLHDSAKSRFVRVYKGDPIGQRNKKYIVEYKVGDWLPTIQSMKDAEVWTAEIEVDPPANDAFTASQLVYGEHPQGYLGLKKPLFQDNGAPWRVPPNQGMTAAWPKCKRCAVAFPNGVVRDQHELHCGVTLLTCDRCGRAYTKWRRFEQHRMVGCGPPPRVWEESAHRLSPGAPPYAPDLPRPAERLLNGGDSSDRSALSAVMGLPEAAAMLALSQHASSSVLVKNLPFAVPLYAVVAFFTNGCSAVGKQSGSEKTDAQVWSKDTVPPDTPLSSSGTDDVWSTAEDFDFMPFTDVVPIPIPARITLLRNWAGYLGSPSCIIDYTTPTELGRALARLPTTLYYEFDGDLLPRFLQLSKSRAGWEAACPVEYRIGNEVEAARMGPPPLMDDKMKMDTVHAVPGNLSWEYYGGRSEEAASASSAVPSILPEEAA